MAKTSAACRNSSLVKKRGAGSFCSTHHHFTTSAIRPSSSTLNTWRTQTTLRSECPGRKSPRAPEPYNMTHSRFVAANSFSRFTSSLSFASVDSISPFFLPPALPASRGPSASATSASRSSESAASTTAEASTPPAPTSRTPLRAAQQRAQHKPDSRNPAVIVAASNPAAGLLTTQRHPQIVRNVPCQLPRGNLCRLAVIALAQERHHRSAGVPGARIIDHWFKPVPNLDPVLSLVGCDQQQHAAIVLLASNSQLLVEINRVILHAFTFERANRHNRHLRPGFLFDFRAQRFEPGFRFRANNARQVGYVARGADLLNAFRRSEAHSQEKQAENQ